MREILFRGKRPNGCWVQGDLTQFCIDEEITSKISIHELRATLNGLRVSTYTNEVIPKTVGQWTGLTDKNGAKIFEGDIVQYINDDDFDCQSIVKFGEYKQDGSGGEYRGRSCIGFYVKVDNFTCPDWCDDDAERFPYWMWQQNILEVASQCEVIGNIYDNPEILK